MGDEPPTGADITDVVNYLEGERLIKAHRNLHGPSSARLIHADRREIEQALAEPTERIEQALAEPTERTEHFVPLVNITNIHGSVIGSQLQQGSPGASQTGHFEIN
ncbi:hypothetical protein [Plantactinospora sp. BB1]|uniref:hypothetical protein n=1 Tax=Plantactinospora sp. BB1 TaxID=2071627 RepID=UPI000D16ED6F|nr:hypothetical protein [Plantactinospora sp. BB1]AVT40286.1 hypothetical protein C6W10_31840 [Plantactinospora sp. BB1]